MIAFRSVYVSEIARSEYICGAAHRFERPPDAMSRQESVGQELHLWVWQRQNGDGDHIQAEPKYELERPGIRLCVSPVINDIVHLHVKAGTPAIVDPPGMFLSIRDRLDRGQFLHVSALSARDLADREEIVVRIGAEESGFVAVSVGLLTN